MAIYTQVLRPGDSIEVITDAPKLILTKVSNQVLKISVKGTPTPTPQKRAPVACACHWPAGSNLR